jgi:hypothetical protein
VQRRSSWHALVIAAGRAWSFGLACATEEGPIPDQSRWLGKIGDGSCSCSSREPGLTGANPSFHRQVDAIRRAANSTPTLYTLQFLHEICRARPRALTHRSCFEPPRCSSSPDGRLAVQVPTWGSHQVRCRRLRMAGVSQGRPVPFTVHLLARALYRGKARTWTAGAEVFKFFAGWQPRQNGQRPTTVRSGSRFGEFPI